jgi:3-phenylpropionate/cinnamic acid dioxygenase small subunit
VTDDDRADIARIVHRYAELLDAGDFDAVAALFTRADWIGAGGVEGHGATYARRQYDAVVVRSDGTPGTRHLITNLVVDVVGDRDRDRAAARSSFVVLQDARPILAGRYHDQFRRDDGGWYLTSRTFHADLFGDLSRHYRSGPHA